MKIDIKFWFTVLCVAILIGVLLTLGIRIGRNSVKPPKPVTQYITDTIYLSRPYVMPIAPKGFNYIVKPTIVEYQKPDMAIVGVLSRKNDSLQQVITNTKGHIDTIIISDNFLTLFPKSPKLLSLYLKYDSLWITLLNPTANVVTLHYPINFPENAYWFSDNTLTSKPYILPRKKTKLKPSLGIYTGLGIPIDGTVYPLLSAQYTQPIRPVQLQLEAQMTINDKPQYIIFAKAGFRIF